MTVALIEDALGDDRNASFLSLASELAYSPEAAGAAAFKSDLGLDARLISVSNTQAFVATNEDHIVLAFRGTESPTSLEGLRDWLLTDACNLLIIPEGQIGTDFAAAGVAARFHHGFMTALADVWEPVFEAANAEIQKKERPLWITGHSLGGALAQMAAWRLKRKFVNVHQVYTFGAPMVGNAEASSAFDAEFPQKIYRYVNSPDLVPMLPTVSLVANDYKHCLTEKGLGGGAAGAAGGAVEVLKAVGSGAVNGILQGTILDDIWKAVISRVAAHGMDSYRALIGKG